MEVARRHPPTPARHDTKSTPPGENLEIVFIGNDLSLAELYRLKLEVDGYWVTTCKTLDDGLRHIKSRMPDLVFVDLGPEGGRPPETLGTLRSDERLREVPIVLLARGDVEAAEPKAFQLGGRDFLVRIDSPSRENFWKDVASSATDPSPRNLLQEKGG